MGCGTSSLRVIDGEPVCKKHFELERVVGQGGFGKVGFVERSPWLGRHNPPGRLSHTCVLSPYLWLCSQVNAVIKNRGERETDADYDGRRGTRSVVTDPLARPLPQALIRASGTP